MTKYILPWEEENIIIEFEKLIPLYPKKTYHLLLIGSPYRSETNSADIKEVEDMESILGTSNSEVSDVNLSNATFDSYENTRCNTMMTEAHDFTKA